MTPAEIAELKGRILTPNTTIEDSLEDVFRSGEQGDIEVDYLNIGRDGNPNQDTNYSGSLADELFLHCFNGSPAYPSYFPIIWAEYFLSKGANINVKVGTSEDPAILIACTNTNLEAVQFLLDNRVDVNAKNKNGVTSLQMACYLGRKDIVEMLLTSQILDVNEGNPLEKLCGTHGVDPMKAQKLEITKLLLGDVGREFNIDINQNSDRGSTPFLTACKAKNLETAEMIYQHRNFDHNVNIKLEDGKTPLHHLCSIARPGRSVRLRVRLLEELLKNTEIDVNVVDKEGKTPLHIACMNNNIDGLRMLLGHQSIDVNKICDGLTVLHLACNEGYVEMVELLLNHEDIDVNIVFKSGRTVMNPLHMAVCQGIRTQGNNRYIRTVQLLLNHPKIDVNFKNNEDNTVLHLACKKIYKEMVEILLQNRDIDVNSSGEDGERPLEHACVVGIEKKNIEVVKLLLRHSGINLSIKNDSNSTPLNEACNEISDILKQSNDFHRIYVELLELLLTKIGTDFDIDEYCPDFETYNDEVKRIINEHLGV